MTFTAALTEVGWVVIDTELVPLTSRWKASWELGERLFTKHIISDFDSFADYRLGPGYTAEGASFHQDDRMKQVLLETLQRKEFEK